MTFILEKKTDEKNLEDLLEGIPDDIESGIDIDGDGVPDDIDAMANEDDDIMNQLKQKAAKQAQQKVSKKRQQSNFLTPNTFVIVK